MKKPTFFLSSTIFDFQDLRSAIKYTLEQRGCLVLASEFNDFRKPLDRHSYEACLESIKQADYFILLIGSRVGGWYDEPGRISITQQEYRAAYELQREGKIQILTFVRSDVWQFREDQKALQRHLKDIDLNTAAKKIAAYPNKHAEDAEFTIRFIEEVGRNRETAAAVRHEGALPTGNWLHAFHDFRDVANVLQTLFLAGFPVEEAAFRRALRYELVEVLRACLIRGKSGECFGPQWFVAKFDQMFPIAKEDKFHSEFAVPTKPWDNFSTVLMHWIRGRIHIEVLPEALTSPTFLQFDHQTGTCEETPAFRALHMLFAEIRGLNQMLDTDVLEVIFKHSPKARGGDHSPSVFIEGMGLLRLISLALRWINIVELASALVAHLDGNPFVMPKLARKSPLKDFDDDILEEVPSDEGIAAYVNEVSKGGAH
ncbi:MAG: DUF4062 domain-containing protein [Rhizomicrobium sp.]|jgi:hypothetical protein